MSMVRVHPMQLRGLPRMSYRPSFNMSRLLSTARRTAYKGSGSKTRTVAQRRMPRSTGGVTTQRDSRVVYRYKRMPLRKRRRWVSFVRKNIATDLAKVGTRTVIYNGSFPITTQGDQKQSVGATHLYGCSPQDVPTVSTEVGLADLRRIINQDPNLTSGADTVYFSSAVMDVTMTNISPTITMPDTGAQINPPVEVDLYDIVYRKECDFNSLQEAFNAGLTATPNVTSGGSWTDVSQRGWTPFAATQALSVCGIKILKKTKYFIPYGDSVTYQIRDPRNRRFRRQDVYNTAKTVGFLAPNGRANRSVLVVCKPVAGIAPSGTVTTSFLKVGATRTYGYKVLQSNQDQKYGAFQA